MKLQQWPNLPLLEAATRDVEGWVWAVREASAPFQLPPPGVTSSHSRKLPCSPGNLCTLGVCPGIKWECFLASFTCPSPFCVVQFLELLSFFSLRFFWITNVVVCTWHMRWVCEPLIPLTLHSLYRKCLPFCSPQSVAWHGLQLVQLLHEGVWSSEAEPGNYVVWV